MNEQEYRRVLDQASEVCECTGGCGEPHRLNRCYAPHERQSLMAVPGDLFGLPRPYVAACAPCTRRAREHAAQNAEQPSLFD